MAEAGLIRFFMPVYNEKFKSNYPDPKHVSIAVAYDLDFADLIVELPGFELRALYWSRRQPRAPMHMVRFPLRQIGGLGALAIERFTTLPPTATQPTEPT
jgi:hypothetical protein